MAKDEETVKSTVSLPADLYWEFQRVATERRLSNKAAVLDAYTKWIESPETGHKVPQPQQPTDPNAQVVVNQTYVQPGTSRGIIEASEGYVMVPCPVELLGSWTAFVGAYARRNDIGERADSLLQEAGGMADETDSALDNARPDRKPDEGITGGDRDSGAVPGNPRDKPKSPRKRSGSGV